MEPYVYDGEYYIKEPYYINESGVPVKIYMRWSSEYSHSYSYSYGYIQNGDTLHRTLQDTVTFYFPNIYWNTPSTYDNCGLTYGFDCKNPFFIMLQFLDEPASCLVYSGPVQNSPADIRSWKAYEKGDTIPGVDSKEYFIRQFYTITQEHRAMAKEKDCQSPASE
jgi:hypothetical protein